MMFSILQAAFKQVVSVNLCDPPCKDDNVQFTTVPLKPLSDRYCLRYCRVLWVCLILIIPRNVSYSRNVRRETTNENNKFSRL